jgi:aminomethyltransferase
MPFPLRSIERDRPLADDMSLRRSPLDAVHRDLDAKLVPFGGWEMPLAYPAGTIAEHLACRSGTVVFDVSHLGTVRVEGPGAFDTLQAGLSNDLRKIGPGRAQYSHVLDAEDASVLDDVIVWWRNPELFDVMPNASNTEGVRAVIGGLDVTDTRVVLAVQGPGCRSILAAVDERISTVRRFGVLEIDGLYGGGAPAVVAGTGYTGEDGVEITVAGEFGGQLWERLVDAGAVPAGLGARDTLRLEAGLPLHGAELGPGITPLQAGLGWVIGWDKPELRGRVALELERSIGPRRHLVGISTLGRRPPRAGSAVFSAEGAQSGVVTSGNFSPVLGHGIALAFVERGVEIGASVTVDVRGTGLDGVVVRLPFVG